MEVCIPSHHKKSSGSGSFTAFKVQTMYAGVTSVVLKRYTEFEELHRTLRGEGIMVPVELPPKKVMKFNPKVLEHRQLGLERYLRGVASLYPVPSALTNFLEVATFRAPTEQWPEDATAIGNQTQPVVRISADAWLHEDAGRMPNTGIQALFDVMYS